MQIPATMLRNGGDGKFKPKLTDRERCEALACVVRGIKYDIVAAAFGVDRRTLNHMSNRFSKHYKNVRRELERLGKDAFLREYFTESVLDRLKRLELSKVPDRAGEGITTQSSGASRRARGKAGIHLVRPEQCSYNHRIEIAWRDKTDDSPEGWWYRDLDGPDSDMWLNCGPDSLLTSQACFVACQTEIIDA